MRMIFNLKSKLDNAFGYAVVAGLGAFPGGLIVAQAETWQSVVGGVVLSFAGPVPPTPVNYTVLG